MNLLTKLCAFAAISGILAINQGKNGNSEINFNYNNTYKYNVIYTLYVSQSNEYIMEFAGDINLYNTPARVTVASSNASTTYPVFVSARQQKGISSWQLPLVVETPFITEKFTSIARTLCPHNNLFDEDEDTCDLSTSNTPIIHITSSSPDLLQVKIQVATEKQFYVHLDVETNITISPSEPRYFFYPFSQKPNVNIDLESLRLKKKSQCNQPLTDLEEKKVQKYTQKISKRSADGGKWNLPKSVILMIESDNDVCAVISIQNVSCPVFDNERDILYDGHHLTMTRRGGITLNQDMYPQGFYIVFIVKSTDEECLGETVVNGNETDPSSTSLIGRYLSVWSLQDEMQFQIDGGREKNFRFKIIETISYWEYVRGTLLTAGFFVGFFIVYAAILCLKSKKCQSDTSPTDTSVSQFSEAGTSTTTVEADDVIDVLIRSRTQVRKRYEYNIQPYNSTENLLSPGNESQTPTGSDAPIRTSRLCVADLSKKRAKVLGARSNLYLWNVLTVAIFYTLPVIQLAVTYQILQNQSGNQDLCYYNFFCAHPLMFMSDFNHVYSNIGYVLLGFLFIIEVARKHHLHKRKTEEEQQLGIPQHFGLLYAMGIALVSEGLLSASYHVCPNSMNFQFDTSFMYVTSVLCMVKIYQSRHPDINARAHATFAVLAFIIFIGLLGILLNANIYIWIAFTIFHLISCFWLTFQIYYMGKIKFGLDSLVCAAKELLTAPRAAMTPTHCGRMVLLILANAANWAIAAYGMYQHQKDFASHLLIVLMRNLFLYTLFYIIMKLLHRESLKWYTWCFTVLTYACWFSSAPFFLKQSTNWVLTPAQSRQYNEQCWLFSLYDSHDIWHFLSSIAMFFSFNMYLTFDDNLSRTHRTEIKVF